MIVDLRSDTLTRPSREMLDAMMTARVGDDVFGEDDTVKALEQQIATMFGMETALFCPSGTMANQIAIKCLTNPMEELITDQTAHVYRSESGGIPFHSAVSVRTLRGERGKITPALIAPEINVDSITAPRTSLVVLENTVNWGGGSYYTLAEISEIATLCHANALKLHLDGARIFNALTETGDLTINYGQFFDTISVCLSKGLGAPVGSVLMGNGELIKKARKIRKVMGGGMRQAGFLAAAGIYALDHNIGKLKADHHHARQLASALKGQYYVKSVMPVDTNIVIFEVAENYQTATLIRQLDRHGIKCLEFGKQRIRFVTYLDITQEMIDETIMVLNKLELPEKSSGN
ncbi:GntG family PLP-dependent aldolase [Parapedobacter lycopersici]|uniref:threonine aldolase family protein n=1 Tax=Parapedobacter lycopersici TaxID=1864939 RepID=UPI003341229B